MFNANALLALLNAKPFVPFRFVTSDGGTVDVVSREMVIPGRNYALVGMPRPGGPETLADQWTTVWYMHVARTEQLQPGAPPFTAPPGDTAGSPSAA